MAKKSVRYWDSATFLAWLLPEPDRLLDCRGVITAAEKGETLIVTCALTLTEVIHLKGHPPLKADQETKIKAFFEHSWINVRDVDRFVGELARKLIWQHGVKPKDSTHLATALRWKVPLFETFDDELCALDRKLGKPAMQIAKPHEAEILALPFASALPKAKPQKKSK